MKNENWFRELTNIEVQGINGGRNGDGADDAARLNRETLQQRKAMKDAADFARKYNTNVGCTSKPLHYSDSGCGYIGLTVGTAAGAAAVATGVGAGMSGFIGNAVGMAAANACIGNGKGGSIGGGSCSSSSSSSHCSSNGGLGGGSCRW